MNTVFVVSATLQNVGVVFGELNTPVLPSQSLSLGSQHSLMVASELIGPRISPACWGPGPPGAGEETRTTGRRLQVDLQPLYGGTVRSGVQRNHPS